MSKEYKLKDIMLPDTHKRNKRLNTTEFNRKAKKRREKAKHDSKSRKKNRRK